MVPIVRCLLGATVAAVVVVGPLRYSSYSQAQIRNFHVVQEGVLYRSGQLSIPGLKRVLHDHGIRTVITLRDSADPKSPPPDLNEEKYCASEGIKYCRITPRNWWAPDGSVPAEKGVRKFREIMDHPENYPVLVHCFAGVHRTGAYVAVYRMEYEHWSNEAALAELRAGGYRNLEYEWDLLEYLESFQPRRQVHATRKAALPPRGN